MNSTLYSRMTTGRRIAAACGVGVLLVGASACGSKSNDNGTTNTSNAGPQTTQNNGNGGQFPGASGKIAEVDGSTAQVQSQQNGQVAVTWNSHTTFTQQVAAKQSDVKVGDCVVAMPSQSDTSSSDSTSTDDTKVTAATVRITSTSGDCTTGFGGPGGGQRPNFNGTPPSGAPSNLPSGAPTNGTGRGQFRGSFGAVGKVTAVSGSGFKVEATRPGGTGSSDTTTTSVAVTTTSSTTFTTNAKASASDVKTGGCMTAQGTTDSTGAVTAKTVALSAAVDGECGGGFFRSRNGGPGGASGDGSSTTGQAS
ncbi:hypothetical protein [Nocardioides marmorisolisilvae]|uniref:DUF5666 domain-containing protein n=1 Tax=Nocardioides marmorisolisilvae TaxID=1542737 RepID=A0A3N0DSS3_9ACTN|nr:hypothetical protein [Nocardioides marmorisolisilvae]RNL78669.1 hypothetical protein EFL95_06175 [Nocardioides marmorisolisilvae]